MAKYFKSKKDFVVGILLLVITMLSLALFIATNAPVFGIWTLICLELFNLLVDVEER